MITIISHIIENINLELIFILMNVSLLKDKSLINNFSEVRKKIR